MKKAFDGLSKVPTSDRKKMKKTKCLPGWDEEWVHKVLAHLLRPGGCFLNLDRVGSYNRRHIEWLKSGGFEDADFFWKGPRMAIFGGFRD